jgi:uncharacterized membrane protein YraQ (UPF0718 family)
MFIGFIEAGVPLGVTFSFLIASPLINEIAVGILLTYFGWKITALYIGSGLVIAIIVGIIIGRLHLERWVEDFIYEKTAGRHTGKVIKLAWNSRFRAAWAYTKSILKKVAPYIALGVAIGAFIHGYAPQDLIVKVAGRSNPFAVPIAVAIGVPLYANTAGTIPIVTSLIEKGVPLGTALAFMMAVTALSFPEMVILRRVLKKPLLAVFFGTVALAIVFTGYLFNAVL